MLIFATSGKGGTGRSVTSCNVMYRRALQGSDVCYLDFDFGSPTAGAVFELTSAATGTDAGGLHSYMQGRVATPVQLDVWSQSDRESLRSQPTGAGQLTLFPGDLGGGEFPLSEDLIRRCMELFLRVEEEFDVCLVDLSAGRSFAVELALEVTSRAAMRSTTCRWLIFHRWTRQHIVAGAGLVFGDRGILRTGKALGHDESELREAIRFVRTAVLDPNTETHLRPAQATWLRECDTRLRELASRLSLGRRTLLGQTPIEPLLQWREQLISDEDVVTKQIANVATVRAFEELAQRLTDEPAWEGL